MADKASHLKIKATLKKRQPKFQRQGSHKLLRVKKVWRAPKGLHSKMKDSRRGYRVKIQSGYQTPRDVRGLDKHGLAPTIVANVTDLAALDPKVHSLILLGGLGGRKKLAILDEATKRKFVVGNAKNDTAEKITSRFKQQQADKKAREQSKSEKQKSLEAKEAEAKKKAKDETADDKKDEHKHAGHDHTGHDHAHEEQNDHEKEEQKEKDKVLHQKE